MCGIMAVLNWVRNKNYYPFFNKGVGRGPENSMFTVINNTLIVGFHRLAINGLNDASNQPMYKDGCLLICNGEIYNYKKLYTLIGKEPRTGSDCEVIIDLYNKYGIDQTLDMLDGVFAFVLYDYENHRIFAARDKYGVRPLFIARDFEEYIFASEIKMIPGSIQHCEQINPGTCMAFRILNGRWEISDSFYFTKGYSINNTLKNNPTAVIHDSLVEAVKKRVETTERPIACLLSGGLDSSLITSIVCRLSHFKVKTFSIGLEGSEDLHYAKKVAEYLDTDHTSITVTEDDFFNAIPEVIRVIESYDTTSVRASVGNYLVSKYISDNTDCKVIFNGDGSDEVTGGYLYFHKAPDSVSFDSECKRLLKDICFFDVLRSDRSISSCGLEARTPFLDKSFVETYLSIPPDIRNHNNHGHMEKQLLRDAFKGYLPDEVLYRRKEAFSDGVSKATRSWHKIIQEYLEKEEIDTTRHYYHNQPQTREQHYYRSLFENEYPQHATVIPYFWMPKWTKFKEGADASARELDIY